MTGQVPPQPEEFESADNRNGSAQSDFEFPSDPISGQPSEAQPADDSTRVEVDEYDWRPSMDTSMDRNGRHQHESAGRGRNRRRRPDRGPGSRRAKTPPGRRKTSLSPAVTAAVRVPGESPTGLSQEYAFMEALAAAAARTRKASSAGQLAAAMVPPALQSVSRYQTELQPVVPVLVWGAAGVAELMHAEDAPVLLGLLPAILDQTAQRLGSLVASGRPVDRQLAADVLAEFTSLIIEQHYGNDRGPRRAEQAQWDGEDEYDSR